MLMECRATRFSWVSDMVDVFSRELNRFGGFDAARGGSIWSSLHVGFVQIDLDRIG